MTARGPTTTSSSTVTDVERNAEGWPVGDFSVTDRDDTVHEATQWWDDDRPEVRTRCRRYVHTTVDDPRLPVTCLLCLTYPLWVKDSDVD